MKTKIVSVVGVIMVILGTIIGVAAGRAADIAGLAVALLGAGAAIYGFWQSRNKDKPKWMTITSIALVCAGALIAGFCGFSESSLTNIMGAVVSIVLALAGMFVSKKLTKAPKKLEKPEATK